MQTLSSHSSLPPSGTSAALPFRLHFASAALALLACSAAEAQPPATRLDDVVVTATRFAEPAGSLPTGVSVITADEIGASSAATVNEALMRLLGVPGRVDLYGGGDYSLDLRGFGTTSDNNQVIVLDGIRLSEADLGGTRLAGIPVDTVERIEVLRGSGAVLYGEGATGGVIVITTQAGAGKERRNAASLYAAAGSFEARELRANATVAAGGFSLDVSRAKRDADQHRDNFRSDFDASAVTAQWRNDWLRVGARHSEDELDTRLPGGLSAAQYADNPRQASKPLDWASIRNTRSGLFGEANLGAWQFGLDLGRRGKQLDSLNAGLPYAYGVEAEHQSLKARHQATLGTLTNTLLFGTDHGRWQRKVPAGYGTAEQSSHAWYLKDDVTLPGSGTRLGAGWREERISKRHADAGASLADRQQAWELGLSQPLGAGASLYGRIGRSFRLANADEFSFTSPGASLKPQTSRDLEAGARWAHAGSLVEARAYRSSLENEIGFDPHAAGPWGPGANANFDPTRRQGVEVDVTRRASRTLDLVAHAALRRSSFRSGPYAGKDVPLAPRRTLALRADWRPAADHRLSGGVNWVSDQHPDFDNQCRMPSYATADARYAYQWKQAEFALGITNLFDRRHYTQAFSCSGGVTGGIYPEAGRAVTASLRLRF